VQKEEDTDILGFNGVQSFLLVQFFDIIFCNQQVFSFLIFSTDLVVVSLNENYHLLMTLWVVLDICGMYRVGIDEKVCREEDTDILVYL